MTAEEDLKLSPIIMGTWQLDRQYWVGVEDNRVIRAVHAALAAGVTTFDTAEEYAGGYSEQVLGKALGARRHEVVICSKVSSDHLRAQQVFDACHRSLGNLGTDYLDLYQIHWPSGAWGSQPTPVAETMEALGRLKEAGKIRAIGVSNFDLGQLREISAEGNIFSLQPPYSLFWRHIDRAIRPYCEAKGIRILAYSSLAHGILTGRFEPGHRFDKGDNRRDTLLCREPHAGRVREALIALRPIAERLGISLGQLALAWLLARPLTHAITGVRDAEQIDHNAAAANMRLDSADLALIDRIGRGVSDPLMDESIPWTWKP